MLNDAQCKAAKATGEAYKLSDAHGLSLNVSKTGHKSWRHKYRYGGKEKLRTLGTFPEVTLKQAREICKADKQLLKEGKDPIIEAKRAVLAHRLAAADTFEVLAREWYAKEQPRWKAVHARDVIESLERDIFDDLGSLPVMSIDSTLVLATLQKVEARGAIETAHRLRQRISSIFAYGIAKGRAIADPAAHLVKVLKATPPSRRWPAAKTIGKAREVLAITDEAEVTPVVKLGSRFLALTSQRPGTIRWMRWDEIEDFDPEGVRPNDGAIWTVPAHKMKQEIGMREDEDFDHPVPLSGAAVDVLCQAWLFSEGSEYVFPGQHSILKPMSENALSYLYLREGLRKRHVPHGWRSSFSTIMNEWVIENGGPRDPLIIDLMLAHVPTGISTSELRYMRAAFIERRRKLATIWAEMLLQGACPVEILAQGRRRRST
ncbi:integrase arm-type DNA-binding domain-containing protein [Sphingomonas sp. CGMCC 1.13654]|uniref:Integrase arm-type DNA-binding domain-containing protein n=1 Tax=Sphingomonas chungangi TaxID=2683589 RepID=A0A838L4Q0_9SPHN|nr:integrase arm-type DNA-binding domain-containing protein [Sphingomonas chungangi]MBA2933880.1 integrase arm-type DNA-binding domain-containing protein [Sphingomonas chungangi]MVW55209.1 DUF4102 domain-containing protein [Sphingomonas chungangi]